MAIVIVEIIKNSKRVAHRYFFDKSEITFGRAYDNDVILEDVHVDPLHAKLVVTDEGTFRLQDCSSVNAIRDKKGRKHHGTISFSQTKDFYFGDTRIRIVDPEQPIPAAVDMKQDRWHVKLINSLWLSLFLLAVVNIQACYTEYISTIKKVEFVNYVQVIATYSGILIGVALVLSFISKVIRREWRMISKLNFICFLYLVLLLGDFVIQVVAFNVYLVKIQWLIDTIWLTLLIIFLMLGLVKHVFLIKRRFRYPLVGGIASIVLGLSVLNEIYDDKPKYIRVPPITHVLKSDSFRYRTQLSDQEFIGASESIFDIDVEEE